MKNYIVGLDIGTTKIACFVGERTEKGRLRIVGFGKTESIGVERGIVKNIRSTADSIRRAVSDASEMAKFDIEEVYVGIAGQHIKSRSNQGSVMIPQEHRLIEKADVDRLIEDQYRIMLDPGEEIIHVFPQCYIVDNDQLDPDIDPVGVAGKCLVANFHIVTGNTGNVHNIRDAVAEAGLKIKGVVLEPIASAYAVLSDVDKAAGVALVDIGGGTTDIAIFQDGIIRHTTVLPLAGNVITNDIRDTCKILKHQAESLKTRFGSCLPSNVSQDDIIAIPGIRNQAPREISVKTLAAIINARMRTLLEQVQYEIQSSGFERQLIAGVVLTGGGAQLKHIREYSELIMGIDTRIGFPDEHMDQQGSNAETSGGIVASVGGGHMHQETGSHVTSNSWNSVLGIVGKRAGKNGTLQYLAFAEHGRANFTLHSDAGRGDGTSKYVGGGLIGKWQNRRDVYVEASIRAGRMHDTASDMLYDEATGRSYGYDVHANYIGGHVGLGKVFYYDNGRNLDVYARYFHMKRDGVSFDAGGHFDLDSVTSSVLRVGARYGATDKKWNWYGGLAYEYEFDGKSTGRADGAPIRAASIEGGSVRAEIGLRMEASKTSPWKADINLSGYAGKRRGISGNVAVAYTF